MIRKVKKTWDEASINDQLRNIEIEDLVGSTYPKPKRRGEGKLLAAVITELTEDEIVELRAALRMATQKILQEARLAKEIGDTAIYDILVKRAHLLSLAVNFDNITMHKRQVRSIVYEEMLSEVTPLSEMEKITRDEYASLFTNDDPSMQDKIISQAIEMGVVAPVSENTNV